MAEPLHIADLSGVNAFTRSEAVRSAAANRHLRDLLVAYEAFCTHGRYELNWNSLPGVKFLLQCRAFTSFSTGDLFRVLSGAIDDGIGRASRQQRGHCTVSTTRSALVISTFRTTQFGFDLPCHELAGLRHSGAAIA
jgi:hypothetical protein